MKNTTDYWKSVVFFISRCLCVSDIIVCSMCRCTEWCKKTKQIFWMAKIVSVKVLKRKKIMKK